MEEFTLRKIESDDFAGLLRGYLAAHDLRYEEDIECAFGLFSPSGHLCGCGCAAGRLLKCFAIDDALRGQNGLGLLVSALTADRFARGLDDLFVVTRPYNAPLFAHCGFTALAETREAALLENRRDGIERFLRAVERFPGDERVGAIVANCNPITNGHLSLIREACTRCDQLYLFIVEENRSVIPFSDRFALAREAVRDIPKVCVCRSGAYMISGITFPTYFLKETEDPSAVQSELDAELFAACLAPALGITVRFAGQEPFDPVTRAYNEAMRSILPRHGIEFCVLPRAEADGVPISASVVRRIAREQGGDAPVLRALVPDCTTAYLANSDFAR